MAMIKKVGFLLVFLAVTSLACQRDEGRDVNDGSQSAGSVAQEARRLSEAVNKGLPASRRVSAQAIPEQLEGLLFGLWSSVSPMTPPPRPYGGFTGTDPFDPEIQKFNQAAIAATLSRAVGTAEGLQINELGDDMKRSIIMAAVQATPAHLELARLESLDEQTAGPVLTAAACFILLDLDLQAETGLGNADLYVIRTSLDITMSEDSLILQANLPASERSLWPDKWASLFLNVFERPPLVLGQDLPRQRLWAWLDAEPRLIVRNVDGEQVLQRNVSIPKAEER